MARRLIGLVALAAIACAALPALAQDEEPNLGSGLVFQGVPTIQELLAQQKACEARRPQRKGSGTISEVTYKRMERIMVAVGKNEYADSEKKLLELAENPKGDYEKAIILQTLGFVYAMQDKQNAAINAYQQAMATNALPQQVHEGMMFNVAQLYLSQENFGKGKEVLQQYVAEACNPVPDAHILLASLHADKKQFRESLKHTDLAIVKARAPKESWMQLKLALHFELKEPARCAEVLVHLIAMHPMKEDYFKQLQGILTEIKKDNAAMAVLALAERRGFINEEVEYKNLSNMYMFMQIPLKAAAVLERGLNLKQVTADEKNLEAMANAYLAAREYEKAETAMARAAGASSKGELYKQLGLIQIESENWKGAMESLQKAQKKGNVKNPGEVAFLIGVCAVNLKQWKTAEAALRQAMEHEKTAKMAAEWLNHLQAEIAYSNAQNPSNGAADDKPAETKTN